MMVRALPPIVVVLVTSGPNSDELNVNGELFNDDNGRFPVPIGPKTVELVPGVGGPGGPGTVADGCGV